MKNSTCYLLLVMLVLSACSPKGPYAVTNKVYKHQADSIAKVIQMQKPAMLIDSSGAQLP